MFPADSSSDVDGLTLVGAYRLYCLYFGGVLLALGQTVFMFACPKENKKYGQSERFVSDELETTTPQRLRQMSRETLQRLIDRVASVHGVKPNNVTAVPRFGKIL